MGTLATHVQVAHPNNTVSTREIELAVDTGATLTKLPAHLLQELGIQPTSQTPALLSDKRVVMRDVGQAWIKMNGQSGIVPVTYGQQDEPALLGVTTLEILGFMVDPIQQKLIPRPILDKG
jgi:clan AA aspartic protease